MYVIDTSTQNNGEQSLGPIKLMKAHMWIMATKGNEHTSVQLTFLNKLAQLLTMWNGKPYDCSHLIQFN